MAYHAKQRMLYYKRFKLDIWGLLKNTLQCKKPNYFLSYYGYGKQLGYLKYLNKKRTQIYKSQLVYKAYFFSKKEEKQGLFWRGYRIPKRMRTWLPKYWMSTSLLHRLRLRLILFANLFFRVLKSKLQRKLLLIARTILKKKVKRKKIYYRAPFIYEVRNKVIKNPVFFSKDQFSSLRIARLFYILYNYKHLKKLNYKAKKQDGFFEQNYILLMECKLASFIYRSSFFPNMFDSIIFVKTNNIWVNKKFVPFVYYIVSVMDIVGFRSWYKMYIYWNFFKRLRRRAFIFLLPKFIYTSLRFLWFILIRVPQKSELINPISVDLYRISTYAN